jgi:hypothetical protein
MRWWKQLIASVTLSLSMSMVSENSSDHLLENIMFTIHDHKE